MLTTAFSFYRMKKLDCFEPCSVQLGDKAFYTILATDVIEMVKVKGGRSLLHYIIKPKGSDHKQEDENTKNAAAGDSQSIEHDPNNHSDLQPPTESGGTDQWSASLNIDVKLSQPTENGLSAEAEINGDIIGESVPVRESADGEDSEYEDEDEDYLSDGGSTASGRSNTSQSSASSAKKKKSKGPALQTKLLKKKRLRKARGKREHTLRKVLQEGARVPVEIIYTFSKIEVMWQVKNYFNFSWNLEFEIWLSKVYGPLLTGVLIFNNFSGYFTENPEHQGHFN